VFVCILPGKAIPEMTYTVSGGTLNSTHSLTWVLSLRFRGRSFNEARLAIGPSLLEVWWLGTHYRTISVIHHSATVALGAA